MAIIHNEWLAVTTYAAGNIVRKDGILYKALDAITGNANNSEPRLDSTNWEVFAVVRIQDYFSLIEAVRLELNRNDDEYLVESIPLFIQLAEESFQTKIRAPIQRVKTLLTVDSESRVEVPTDLLQVVNMRFDDSAGVTAGGSILNRGYSEILAGNFEEYIDLKRHFGNNIDFSGQNGRNTPSNYDAPVYWFDSTYFYIAPNVEEGTVVELYYYSRIPQLGETRNLVNTDGQPINSAGQNVTEWTDAAPANNAGNFVQAMHTFTTNWFVDSVPHMVLYGAVLAAESYLKEDPRIPLWQEKFRRAEIEAQDLIQRFEEGRHHTQQIYNAYSV